MAEFTNVSTVAVLDNASVPFTESVVGSAPCIMHRVGSGIVTLRGITNQCKARFLVTYSGNISIPTGGTVQAISMAISLNGEPLESTRMIVTPAAATEFFNVSSSAYIDVPKDCCLTVSVRNTSGQTIDVANSNLIVTRVA